MIKKLNIRIGSMLTIVLMVISILNLGCSKKEPIKEVVSIHDILGEKTQIEKPAGNEIVKPELDGSFVSEINQKLFKNFRSSPHNKSTLIDRFSAVSVEKATYISLSDSLAAADLFVYNFKDTAATYNAFNNWLACFGTDCDEITVKVNKSRVNEGALWCGVYENSIVIMKFSRQALVFKNELKQTVFQSKAKALQYTLNVTVDNQLKWD